MKDFFYGRYHGQESRFMTSLQFACSRSTFLLGVEETRRDRISCSPVLGGSFQKLRAWTSQHQSDSRRKKQKKTLKIGISILKNLVKIQATGFEIRPILNSQEFRPDRSAQCKGIAACAYSLKNMLTVQYSTLLNGL